MPLFTRSVDVPRFRVAGRFKPFLRRDFRYQCAYCGITEVYRRGIDTFGADHFRPRSIFPDLEFEYPNLYYCCNQCNRYKGATWPDDDEVAGGFQFAETCVCDPFIQHFIKQKAGTLSAVTPAGEYTLDNLRLNCEELVRFRTRRAQIQGLIERCLGKLRDPELPLDH